MRLLNLTTLEFKEFWGDEVPAYIILSHRWGEDEPTYNTFKDHQARQSEGFQKIAGFCRTIGVYDPGIQWLWVDTACIDKTNMVELSEALNSMFRWYRNAERCYAYLQDVTEGSAVDIGSSVWFSRGWTLQELLAPSQVLFLSHGWRAIGVKSPRKITVPSALPWLNYTLSSITGVPLQLLRNFDPSSNLNIKRSMTWMKNRRTTRPEDQCYSMLGIFAVYMSPIYGEGRDHAFQRLIREIWNEHSPGSKIDNDNYHVLTSSYHDKSGSEDNQSGVHVWDWEISLPWHIFCLEEDISGTLYTVIKMNRRLHKIYEDGAIGEQVGLGVGDPNEVRLRPGYDNAGRPEMDDLGIRVLGKLFYTSLD